MKIAFFGSSLLSAYWNGAATYYRGILSALFERRHQIVFYEPDAWDRQRHRDLTETPYAQTVVYAVEDESAVIEMVQKAARESDLLVKASGVGVFDALLEQAVLELRRPDSIVAFWDVDAAATLERIGQDEADPFRSLIPLYDLVLTYGGGDAVVQNYQQLGAQRCLPIYNALDPSTHHPVPADPSYDGALSFLGNRLPDREARVFEFFFRPAQANRRMRFILGGSGWDDAVPAYANIAYLGPRLYRSTQRLQLNAHGRPECLPGKHGALRLLSADSRVRGRRRRRLSDYRCLGWYRRVSRAGPRVFSCQQWRRGRRTAASFDESPS